MDIVRQNILAGAALAGYQDACRRIGNPPRLRNDFQKTRIARDNRTRLLRLEAFKKGLAFREMIENYLYSVGRNWFL
jgi:hypothetical protein